MLHLGVKGLDDDNDDDDDDDDDDTVLFIVTLAELLLLTSHVIVLLRCLLLKYLKVFNFVALCQNVFKCCRTELVGIKYGSHLHQFMCTYMILYNCAI
jgi:hypothetical protein